VQALTWRTEYEVSKLGPTNHKDQQRSPGTNSIDKQRRTNVGPGSTQPAVPIAQNHINNTHIKPFSLGHVSQKQQKGILPSSIPFGKADSMSRHYLRTSFDSSIRRLCSFCSFAISSLNFLTTFTPSLRMLALSFFGGRPGSAQENRINQHQETLKVSAATPNQWQNVKDGHNIARREGKGVSSLSQPRLINSQRSSHQPEHTEGALLCGRQRMEAPSRMSILPRRVILRTMTGLCI
jgi:hypothetical protein